MPEQAVRPSGRLVFHVRPAWAILIQFLRTTDNTTHVDEVLRAMDDLVRAGKVLYLGISDTPAWQASRMQAIADLRGWSPFVAMQMEYNLVERTVDRDLIPMAREMGMGIVVWSPLANGLLTGKYSASDLKKSTRAELTVGDRKRRRQHECTAPLLRVDAPGRAQAGDGFAHYGTAHAIYSHQLARLNARSAIEAGFPHDLLAAPMNQLAVSGGVKVSRR